MASRRNSRGSRTGTARMPTRRRPANDNADGPESANAADGGPVGPARGWVDMGLDALDTRAAALVGRELESVKRFRGNPHICQHDSALVSTAQHVENVHRLGVELMADMPDSPAARALARRFHRQVECHDWGETIKEFFSFYTELKLEPGDIYETERVIAEHAIRLAYAEAATSRAGLVSDAIAGMREKTRELEGLDAARAVQTYIDAHPPPAAPPGVNIDARVARWMHAYDEVENAGLRADSFTALAVKTLESVEAEIWFHRRAGQGPGARSVADTDSFALLSAIERSEKNLGRLASLADGPAERALACNLAARVYDEIATKLDLRGGLVDRDVEKGVEPGAADSSPGRIRRYRQRLQRRFAAQQRHRPVRRDLSPDLDRPILRADELAGLYRDARDSARAGRWLPKEGEILVRARRWPLGLPLTLTSGRGPARQPGRPRGPAPRRAAPQL